MTRKTHQAAAFMVTGTALACAEKASGSSDTVQAIIALGISAYACLLPDLDTPNSYLSRKLPILYLPVWVFRLLVKCIGLIPGPQQKWIRDFYKSTGHRGFSHYPFTWLLLISLATVICLATGITVPTYYLFPAVLGFVCGVFSHIAGDVFFGGVALLYPFCRERVKPTSWKTGGWQENVAFLILIFADFALAVWLL